jgi:alkanesulfonate monooxygenase SsuD/methylene tetrahydromethanopterin reductase-like flavin-dependent oxidoreductase (luciferase family)
MAITDEHIENWFTYHAPTQDQLAKYAALRESAKKFAGDLVALTPPSADQTAAIRHLRECVMTANAAIACDGR